MKKHFVTFFSPGTFIAEDTVKPIKSWDIATAKRMALAIKERHGATPYGFQFTTRTRTENELDSKISARSPMYFLGGKIETIDDVAKRADPKEEILLRNMRANKWNKIIINDTSWRWTQPLQKTDVVLEFKP